MPRRSSNFNNECSKDKLRMRVKRPHESEEQIVARNSRSCAPLASVNADGGKGGPVKIITDTSVETIVFGMKNDSLDDV